MRLCGYFGVDPDRPAAFYRAPRSRKPLVFTAAIAISLVGAFLLGGLTGR